MNPEEQLTINEIGFLIYLTSIKLNNYKADSYFSNQKGYLNCQSKIKNTEEVLKKLQIMSREVE